MLSVHQSRTSSSAVELNDLPNELLTKILDSLEFRSKLSAELVCKRWHDIINASLDNTTAIFISDDIEIQSYKPFAINRYQNIVNISLKQFAKFEQEFQKLFPAIISRFSNLKALFVSLTETNELTVKCMQNTLRLITVYCDSDLTHISLNFNVMKIRITVCEVFSLCRKYPNVHIFQISSTQLMMNELCIQLVVENWRKLETLIVDTYDMNTEPNFLYKPHSRDYFANISPNITRIELPSYMLTESAVNELAKQSLPKFKVLRTTDINNGRKFINAIRLICHHFPSLTSVDCSMFERIKFGKTDITLFMRSLSKLKKLKHLSILIDCWKPILDFKTFSYLKCCQTIRSLKIELSILTADCIDAITVFMPQLLELRLLFIRFFANSSDECVLPIKNLKQLKRLTLSTTPELTDASLTEIIETCTNLEYIDLSFCAEITTITILSAVTRVMKAPNNSFRLCVDSRFKDFIQTAKSKLGKNILKIL